MGSDIPPEVDSTDIHISLQYLGKQVFDYVLHLDLQTRSPMVRVVSGEAAPLIKIAAFKAITFFGSTNDLQTAQVNFTRI